MSIMPPGSESNNAAPDWLTPPMRELADGMAQYVASFMSCFDNCPDVDWQYMAEDFVDSCVVGIMQIDGGS